MARICDACGARLLSANGVACVQTAHGPEDYCRTCWERPTPCTVCGEPTTRGDCDVRRVTVDGTAFAFHWRCEEDIVLAYLRTKLAPAVGVS